MPVLSVSKKLRRATVRFVHWSIEQSLPDAKFRRQSRIYLASLDGAPPIHVKFPVALESAIEFCSRFW